MRASFCRVAAVCRSLCAIYINTSTKLETSLPPATFLLPKATFFQSKLASTALKLGNCFCKAFVAAVAVRIAATALLT